jgi:hypothetical protein
MDYPLFRAGGGEPAVVVGAGGTAGRVLVLRSSRATYPTASLRIGLEINPPSKFVATGFFRLTVETVNEASQTRWNQA